jgi:hypothetical protein
MKPKGSQFAGKTKFYNAQCYLSKLLSSRLLVSSEGGVCGKFNLRNCCLQIDDEGKVMEEITEWGRLIAHVPIQTWRRWNPNDYLEDGSLPWADSKA